MFVQIKKKTKHDPLRKSNRLNRKSCENYKLHNNLQKKNSLFNCLKRQNDDK